MKVFDVVIGEFVCVFEGYMYYVFVVDWSVDGC